MLHGQALIDGPTRIRAGVRFGVLAAEIVEEVRGPSFVYGTIPLRLRTGVESKPGLGGGVFGDLRFGRPGQPLWAGLNLDAVVAKAALDNGFLLNNDVDGELLFAWGTLGGRVGYAGEGIAPYVGFAGTLSYAKVDLDLVPRPVGPTNLESQAIEFGTRSAARVLVGLEFGRRPESFGRLQVAIWKAAADGDLAFSALVLVRL